MLRTPSTHQDKWESPYYLASETARNQETKLSAIQWAKSRRACRGLTSHLLDFMWRVSESRGTWRVRKLYHFLADYDSQKDLFTLLHITHPATQRSDFFLKTAVSFSSLRSPCAGLITSTSQEPVQSIFWNSQHGLHRFSITQSPWDS